MNRRDIAFVVGTLIIAAALAMVPTITAKESIINLLVLVYIYVMMASSWNIIGGIAGQVNLGHAAFFGLGSLVSRILWTKGWPLSVSMILGALVPVAFALIIGAPSFKLRGVYFAIGTLAMAQILFITTRNLFPMISSLPTEALATYSLAPRYYMALGMTLLTVLVVFWLSRSRWGLGMIAVREETSAAESLGVSALQHKLLALCLSAFFAGLAGGVFAYYSAGYYLFFPFFPTWTFDAVMATYIGGTGTVIGPIIGAVFYVLVKEILALRFVELHPFIFGTLFILVVLFLPGGMIQIWSRLRRLFRRAAPVPSEGKEREIPESNMMHDRPAVE